MTIMNRRRAMALMGSGASLALPTTLVEAAAPVVAAWRQRAGDEGGAILDAYRGG